MILLINEWRFVCRSEFERILVNHKQQINSLQDRIADLETGLASKNSELMQERQIKEDLMNQAFSAVQSQDTERMSSFLKVFFHYVRISFYVFRESEGREVRQVEGSLCEVED